MVVFCRFIATAHYVARHFRENLMGVAVAVVTGEMPPEEREERVTQIGAAQAARVLVATDCMSEGVNLQEHFDAVVPLRPLVEPHTPRAAGGPRRSLRSAERGRCAPTLLYGVNNPVDGTVLQVILA